MPRRTPMARASGLASMTGPGSHGRPPSTSGPGGKGSELRARVRPRGRCGRKRWRSRMVGGLSIGGLWYGGLERGLVDEEVVVSETGIPLPALRIEDPEGGAAALRAVAIAGDERLGPLPDDVAAQADPRPSDELESDAGRLGDRGRETAGQARRAGSRRSSGLRRAWPA